MDGGSSGALEKAGSMKDCNDCEVWSEEFFALSDDRRKRIKREAAHDIIAAVFIVVAFACGVLVGWVL